ncbi:MULTISPECIES: S8 family serine peptidase [Streptococcus]|uniref:S8 family serine peptidase n=1 Tax=Streptococcus caledonicus TaxID=2614158 RepID=A0ABW0UCK3_9STRE|nr:S8 family serine peptidase [Streptococcus sp. S784/96/1]
MNKKISVAVATSVVIGCASTSVAWADEVEQPLINNEIGQANTPNKEESELNTVSSDQAPLKEALEELKDVRQKHHVDGRGKIIALVDSGVDTSHPDLRLDDDAVSSSKLTPSEKKDGSTDFTAKIPHGYNYTEGNFRLRDDVPDPHGQHVAGILAGNSKDPNGVIGVAPNAQLLGYKTFSDSTQKISPGANDAVDHAINDAVEHGADVVNLSLGLEGSGLPGDIHGETIKNAVDKGVVIVSSIGNYSSSTSSSTYDHYANRGLAMKDSAAMVALAATPQAIGVGAVQNKVLYAENMIVDGESYPHWNVGKATQDLKPRQEQTVELVNANLATQKDVETLGDKLKGKVALIYRGEDAVYKKAERLKDAGAIGAILINAPLHASREDYRDKFITSYEHIRTSDFWYVSVSGKAGEQLVKPIANIGDTKTIKLRFTTEKSPYVLSQHDRIAGFSSWGPTSDLELKPDLVAPGQDIRSTFNDGSYGVMSGTSMSSPYVAGVSTLLSDKIKGITGSKERLGFYKGFSNVELNKLLLMNTAKPLKDLGSTTGDLEYSPRVQGAGLVDADAALSTKVFATGTGKKGVVTLKEIKSDEVTFTATLYNFGDTAQQFDIKHSKVLSETVIKKTKTEREATSSIFTKDEAGNFTEHINEVHPIAVDGGELTSDHKVLIQPNSSATVTFKLKTGQVKDDFVEGFIYFVPKDKTHPELSLPYFGFKGDWSAEPAIDAPRWEKSNLAGLTGVFTAYDGRKGHNVVSYLEKGVENKGDVPNPDNIAFTNRRDTSEASSRNVVPRLSFLRNVRDYEVAIVDGKEESSKVLQVVQTGHFKRKLFYSTLTEANHANAANAAIESDLRWEGKVYNPEIADDEEVPEGQYYYRIRTKIHDSSPVQTMYLPFRIDNTDPTMTAELNEDKSKVTITTADNHKIWKVLAMADGKSVSVAKVAENTYEIKDVDKLDAYRLRVQAMDFAGNPSEEKEFILNEEKDQPRRRLSLLDEAIKSLFDQDIKSEPHEEKEAEDQPAYINMFNWAMYGKFTGKSKINEEDGKLYYDLNMAIQNNHYAVVTTTNKSATDSEMGQSKDYSPIFSQKFETVSQDGQYRYKDYPVLIKEGFNIINIKIYDKDDKLVMEEGNILYYDEHAPRLQLKNQIDLYDDEDNMADGALTSIDGTIYARNGRVVLEGTVADNGPKWVLTVNGNNIATHYQYQKEGDNEKPFKHELVVKEDDEIKIKLMDDQENARTIRLTVKEDNQAPTIKTNLKPTMAETDIPEIELEDNIWSWDETAPNNIITINGKPFDFDSEKPLSYYKLEEVPNTYVVRIKAVDKAGNVTEETHTIGEKPFDLTATLKKQVITADELTTITELIDVPKHAKVDILETSISDKGEVTTTIVLTDIFGRQTTQVLTAKLASNQDSSITAELTKQIFKKDELNDITQILNLPKDVSATLIRPITVPDSSKPEQVTARVRLFRNGKVNEKDFTFTVVSDKHLNATLRKETINISETYDLNGLLELPEGITASWSVPIAYGKKGKVTFKVILKDQYGQSVEKEFTVTVLEEQLPKTNHEDNSKTTNKIPKISTEDAGAQKARDIQSDSETTDTHNESALQEQEQYQINAPKMNLSQEVNYRKTSEFPVQLSTSKKLPKTGGESAFWNVLVGLGLLMMSRLAFSLSKRNKKE